MPETVADGIPYLMTGDFVGTNELNFDGTKMISEEDYCQLSQKIKPEKGDILFADRKSTRLNSSHITRSRMPSSA